MKAKDAGAQRKSYKITDVSIESEPYYRSVSDEIEIFEAAFKAKIPVILKGPTGCGKTRFVEYMTWRLNAHVHPKKMPLITVPCHEDIDADDLKGRFLLSGEYQAGPALVAVRDGGLLYLDEVVEARPDTTVVIHPLADHRRTLMIEKLGELYQAAPDTFMLAMSYNPGYQRKTKDLKPSTKQRFIALEFDYPPADIETEIIRHESGVDEEEASRLRSIAERIRRNKGLGLDEGVSTRLLVYAGMLITQGIKPKRACDVALINPLTDDKDTAAALRKALEDVVKAFYG